VLGRRTTKNATAHTEYSVTYGIDIPDDCAAQQAVRPEKAAHYTQRFAVLQESVLQCFTELDRPGWPASKAH
jgi:hypothetical protein